MVRVFMDGLPTAQELTQTRLKAFGKVLRCKYLQENELKKFKVIWLNLYGGESIKIDFGRSSYMLYRYLNALSYLVIYFKKFIEMKIYIF